MLRRRLKRLDALARIRASATAVGRTLNLLERCGSLMSLGEILDALDPTLENYVAITSALHNLAKRGQIARPRHGFYRALPPDV